MWLNSGGRAALVMSATLVASTTAASEPRPSSVHRTYEQHALQNPGNPSAGRTLFQDAQRTKCAVCHRIDDRGGEVGPELSAIGGKFDRPHLIESLLEPSRQIVAGYRTATIATDDGHVRTGIVKQQDERQVTLLDAEGARHEVARARIESLAESPASLMPEGLERLLSPAEFTDLIAYLESLRPASGAFGAGVAGPIRLPAGFEVHTVATGLTGATALEVLPDGRVLLCEQTGAVRVVENGHLLEEPFVRLPVEAFWERGVIGVTCHPLFPREPYVYVCWVAKSPYPHHRVSRFTAERNVAQPGSELVLLEGDNQSKLGGDVPAGHQGGALHFGRDGKLYVGLGDQTAGLPAQRLDSLLGKILRLEPDGGIPADNPFVEQANGKYRTIWARGCRNPFTFAVRRSDGLMLINDVGGEQEEINVGRAGANYGWPVVEHGARPQYDGHDYVGPIHGYPQSSINGGDFCPADWPAPWAGRYFFADFVQGWINTIDPEGQPGPRDATTFATGVRRPVDLRFGPGGSLYVLLRNAWVIDDKFEPGTGSLLEIRPSGQRAEPAG